MIRHEAEEFNAVFSQLSLPGQVAKAADLLGLLQGLPLRARGRPISEIVQCIEEIDANQSLAVLLGPTRALLVQRAVRHLLKDNPDAPLDWAALPRSEILDLLPRLHFTPAIEPNQIGCNSIDLTLGVARGHQLGDSLTLKPGETIVLPSLEQHGPWPGDVIGRVTVRSKDARLSLESPRSSIEHLNSLWIMEGSRGPIFLELRNDGKDDKRLVLGKSRLVQLLFLRVARADRMPSMNGHSNGHTPGTRTLLGDEH